MKSKHSSDQNTLSEETMQKIRQAYHSLEAFQLTEQHIQAKAKLKEILSVKPNPKKISAQ